MILALRARVGLLQTTNGALLAHAFLINKPKNKYNEIAWLDRVAIALMTCGRR